MQEPIKMLEELFSIKVSEKNLNKLKLVRFISFYLNIIALLASIAAVVYHFPLFKAFFYEDFNNSRIHKLEGYSSFIYITCFSLIYPIQAYYFYRFCKSFHTAVSYFQEEKFTKAIQSLLLNCIFCTVTFSLNFISLAFSLYLKYS